MPIIFDPEFQVELEKVRDKAISRDRAMYGEMLYMAIAFAAVFGALRAVGADAPTIISAMIVVASLGLAYFVITVGAIIHVTLVINGAGDEWVGRKQLGEYRPPSEA